MLAYFSIENDWVYSLITELCAKAAIGIAENIISLILRYCWFSFTLSFRFNGRLTWRWTKSLLSWRVSLHWALMRLFCIIVTNEETIWKGFHFCYSFCFCWDCWPCWAGDVSFADLVSSLNSTTALQLNPSWRAKLIQLLNVH